MEAYRVQLRVRSKQLRVGRGPAGHIFRTSDEMRYLIGSADDAFLCCRHPDVKSHHCWIVVHEQRGVEVRRARGQVLVNGTVIEDRLALTPGDVLTVGPLELEVYFQQTEAERRELAAAIADPVEEEISDWLINEDEAERQRRRRDKKDLLYKVDPSAPVNVSDSSEQEEPSSGKKKSPPPARKKPGKLPQRPPTTPNAPSSDAAAEGALKRIFTNWGAEKIVKQDEKKT